MKRVYLFLFLFSISLSAQNVKLDALALQLDESFNTFKPVGLAIAVINDGKVVLNKTYGFEDVENKSEITASSLFNIASCSKAFTSTLMAMMVEEKKVSWKDKVVDHFPGFKLKDSYISQNLNLVDIFSHRSGFKTFVGDLLWYRTNYTNQEIMRRMQYLPIKYGFRERYGYQNNMFNIGGEIISKVSGKSWSDNLQERIFDKVGMSGSRPSQDEIQESDAIALPHSHGNKLEDYHFVGAKPAASIYSNIDDLSKWVLFNLNDGIVNEDTLLKKSSMQFLKKTHFAQNVSNWWKDHGRNFAGVGLGWKTSDYHGNLVVEHSGGMPGYISKVALIPHKNAGFVILNNDEHSMVNYSVYFQVLDYLCRDTIEDWPTQFDSLMQKGKKRSDKQKAKRLATRIEDTNPSLEIDEYSATYQDKWYGNAAIKFDDDELFLTLMPAKETFNGVLEHWHYNTFKVQFKDPFLTYGLVTFHFNEYGKIQNFTIDLPVADFHFDNLDFKKIE